MKIYRIFYLLALLIASPAFAQQLDPANGIEFTQQRIETFAIVIRDGSGKVTVSVRWTGEVVLGEGVTLDEASMKFWEQLGQHLSQARPKVK
jgi:ABC-type protease/lipase transport system fused ATPase/permease subunit